MINLKNWRDWGATILGYAVAIAMAWENIDFANFELTIGNIMKLLLSAIIATGGHVSVIKKKEDEL